MSIEVWLQNAVSDAERRGMPELKPILEGLAKSTAAIRAADFNDDASGASVKPERAPQPEPTRW
jgi:hypothetical protein